MKVGSPKTNNNSGGCCAELTLVSNRVRVSSSGGGGGEAGVNLPSQNAHLPPLLYSNDIITLVYCL